MRGVLGRGLSHLCANHRRIFHVAVLGGVKTTNVKDVIEAGADLIVSGSDVFADKENRIRAYKEIFKNYEKSMP